MQEKIFFKDSSGLSLCGILSDPLGKSKTIIILCHGFSSSKDSGSYRKFETAFNAKGFATLRFDFFGHGESEGAFADVTISKAVDDILSAIMLAKEKGYKRIGLIGSSFGGIACLLAAAKSKDVVILGLRAPVSDYHEGDIKQFGPDSEWKKNGFKYYLNFEGKKFRLNYSFYEDAITHHGYREASKINVPTIIVHGGKDDRVPVGQSIKTNSAIRDSKLVILPYSDHHFSYPGDYDKCINEIASFFFEHLKA